MHLFRFTIHKDKINTPMSMMIQILLIVLTLLGTLLISLGLPEYGLVVNGFAQIFWLYNTYIIYREDNTQWGMLLLSIIMSFIVGYGILNYWYFV